MMHEYPPSVAYAHATLHLLLGRGFSKEPNLCTICAQRSLHPLVQQLQQGAGKSPSGIKADVIMW